MLFNSFGFFGLFVRGGCLQDAASGYSLEFIDRNQRQYSQMIKERLYYFDTIKFILILFVIIQHCSTPYLTLMDSEWTKDFYCIMPYRMSLFTMISGYFFRERTLAHRINTYLIPCIVFSTIYLCMQRMSPIPFIHDRPISQLGSAMWYLYVLFFYNIFTQMLKKIPTLILLCGSIVLALLICKQDFFWEYNFQISKLISNYPFFLLGILICEKQLLRFRENKKVRYLAFFLFLFCIVGNYLLCKFAGLGCFISAFSSPISRNGELYGILMCSIMSFCVLLFFPNKHYAITPYGRNTFAPYVLHMCLVYPICWTLCIPYMNTWYGLIINMVVTPLLCLLLFHPKVNEVLNKLLGYIHIKSK